MTITEGLTVDDEALDAFLTRPLDKDMRDASRLLQPGEIRYLVDAYYSVQKQRVAQGNQLAALVRSGEPHAIVARIAAEWGRLEKRVALVLDTWGRDLKDPVSDDAKARHAREMAEWSRGHVGIGPIIAAGLAAHIDIERAPTAGAIWAFAGLDPTKTWDKGQKRPWNASLKLLCWKLGESFTKVANREGAFYGQVYAERKRYEVARNDAGTNAETARARLAGPRAPGPTTQAFQALSQGKLPDGQLHLRAQRYAVKLFLSHYHGEAYQRWFHTPPPLPYPVAHQGHAHLIPAPPRAKP